MPLPQDGSARMGVHPGTQEGMEIISLVFIDPMIIKGGAGQSISNFVVVNYLDKIN
jgi:hypothetical protein